MLVDATADAALLVVVATEFPEAVATEFPSPVPGACGSASGLAAALDDLPCTETLAIVVEIAEGSCSGIPVTRSNYGIMSKNFRGQVIPDILGGGR